MAKLSLNPTEILPIVEEPIIEKPASFKQKIACYWEIKATEKDGEITARSNMGDKYEGTIKEFNKRLRE